MNGMPAMKKTAAAALAAIAFSLAPPGPATAETLDDMLVQMEEASEALGRGDYQTAFALFQPLAEKEFPQAQFALGLMYEKGQGAAQDDARAAQWYARAAGQDLAEAQVSLGFMYFQGRGVAQDHAEAAYWFRQAAEQGNARAQFNLGVLYMSGEGVAEDDAEAVAWFRKAAAQGHGSAGKMLDMYRAVGIE